MSDSPPSKPLSLERLVTILGGSSTIKQTAVALSHLTVLGFIVAEWSIFEAQIDERAVELAQISSPAVLCFTSQVAGPGRKLDAYIALARLRGASNMMKALHQLAKDAMGVAERRNRVVHDPWLLLGQGGPFRVETTARRKLRNEYIPVSAAEMAKLSEDVLALIERFIDLDRQVRAAVETSPDKPRS
jgi:hypothetical protein